MWMSFFRKKSSTLQAATLQCALVILRNNISVNFISLNLVISGNEKGPIDLSVKVAIDLIYRRKTREITQKVIGI